VYGLVSDSFPLYGSRKKSYLMLNSGIGVVIMLLLCLSTQIMSKYYVAVLLFLYMITFSFNVVIIDSLLVQ
jgi:MFS-type transporter involved in bile tolerance (Atg22 family)